jgi:COP9 signalosome complex subunit 5
MGERVKILMIQMCEYLKISCLFLFLLTCSPHFFKDIKISALALLKMVMHARSGGTLEVMGLLLGKVAANTMIVMDSFALPVEGTETRVNAQAQAYEYMTAYIEAAKQVNIYKLAKNHLKEYKYNPLL